MVGCLLVAATVGRAQVGDTIIKIDSAKVKERLVLAQKFMMSAEYDSCIMIASKVKEEIEKIIGIENNLIVDAFDLIGLGYYYKGLNKEAIDYYTQSLEIKFKIFEKNHRKIADSYNNIANCYQDLGLLDDAIQNHESALKIRIEVFDSLHQDVAMSYNNLGGCYFSKGDFERAIELHKKSLKIKSKILNENHISLASSYGNIGLCYKNLGYSHYALENFKIALRIFLRNFGKKHPNVGSVYVYMANIFKDIGDIEKAMLYNEEALDIMLATLGSNHHKLAGVYQSIANCYFKNKAINKALFYQKKAMDIILSNFGESHPQTTISYLNLGAYYEALDSLEKAKEYLFKGLKINEDIINSSDFDISYFFNNLGTIYAKEKNYIKALMYYEKALKIRINTFKNNHPDIALSYLQIANILAKTGDYEKSIYLLDSAIVATGYSTNGIEGCNSKEQLCRILHHKAKALSYIYEKNKEFYYLDQAKNIAVKAIEVISTQVLDFSQNNSVINLFEESYPIFEDGLRVMSKELKNIEDYKKSFEYMERSKSFVLRQALKESQLSTLSNVSDSLIEQEKKLKYNINYYEKILRAKKLTIEIETDTTVLKISSRLFDLRQQHEALKKRFETDYPMYYKLKYDLSTVTLQGVQHSLLAPDQTLLSYFVGDSAVYIFAVNRDTFAVREIKKTFPLEKWTTELVEGLTPYASMKRPPSSLLASSTQKYIQHARLLYDTLIAPVKSLLREKVVIIPDGTLGSIPFETLLSKKPLPQSVGSFSSYPYLMKEHTISYNYSATLWREMQQRVFHKTPEKSMLAVAPCYRADTNKLVARMDTFEVLVSLKGDTLLPLTYSEAEVTQVVQVMGGDARVGDSISLQQFKDNAGDYRYLHLSTHGILDDRVGDYAYLAFGTPDGKRQFEKLYVRDLYNMSLNAEMVTISACEMGKGELKRGEGIISMARGFAYAGAKSIFTTLWKVDEARTNVLMVDFYGHLKTGKSKDAALRQAKLDFLKKYKTVEAHPFFWAGFIGIGDMRAVGAQ
jgi:CHAT domain-containing protein/Tfp pilus assembly protein PilF